MKPLRFRSSAPRSAAFARGLSWVAGIALLLNAAACASFQNSYRNPEIDYSQTNVACFERYREIRANQAYRLYWYGPAPVLAFGFGLPGLLFPIVPEIVNSYRIDAMQTEYAEHCDGEEATHDAI
ncbi:MAG: hypothetical protein NXI24_02055 [bacterium]|nr:hypothetical protein [bacterium]